MIRTYTSEQQGDLFYMTMGRYFASLEIAKELERQLYNKPNTTWYISTFKNTVLGFVSVCENNNHYFIDNLYVKPEHRKDRIATELITEIVESFGSAEKPIKCVACNPYALKIFYSLGFEEVGQNGKYKKLIKH